MDGSWGGCCGDFERWEVRDKVGNREKKGIKEKKEKEKVSAFG